MKTSNIIASLSAVAAASAAESICDTYTAALFASKGGNTAANQETLLTLVVNTAVIGNYTQPNVGIKVDGLLAPAYFMGENVNLLPYFNGALASTNNGGKCGVSMNFLDGGGAAPLMMNLPANSTSSAQYTLLTHLYEFFASLLGCSEYGNTTIPYAGDASMYEVHKFMGLSAAEFGWFVYNVGQSAASFGVSSADVTAVGTALNTLFGYRCEPEEVIPPVPSEQLQSICIASSCPLSPNAECQLYAPVVEPVPAASASANCPASSPTSSATSYTTSYTTSSYGGWPTQTGGWGWGSGWHGEGGPPKGWSGNSWNGEGEWNPKE